MCAVCDLPISAPDLEYELQYDRQNHLQPGLQIYRLHLRCFAVWELERIWRGYSLRSHDARSGPRAESRQMQDESVLRDRVRQLLHMKRIPRRPPDRTGAAPASGCCARCASDP